MTLLIKPAQENIDDVSVRIKAPATNIKAIPDITIQAIEYQMQQQVVANNYRVL